MQCLILQISSSSANEIGHVAFKGTFFSGQQSFYINTQQPIEKSSLNWQIHRYSVHKNVNKDDGFSQIFTKNNLFYLF